MSNAIRKVERGVVRKQSTRGGFVDAWSAYREKKWDGNVPRDTSKKKRYFADNPKILCAEIKATHAIKEAFAKTIKEKIKEKREASKEEN